MIFGRILAFRGQYYRVNPKFIFKKFSEVNYYILYAHLVNLDFCHFPLISIDLRNVNRNAAYIIFHTLNPFPRQCAFSK